MAAQSLMYFLIGLCGSISFLSLVPVPGWLLVGACFALGIAAIGVPPVRLRLVALLLGCIAGIARVLFPEPLALRIPGAETVSTLLQDFSARLNAVFQSIFPNPVAGFSQGIITGGQGVRFSKEFSEALRITSTMHLIAVSGYNVSLIARYLQRLLVWATVHRKFIWLVSLTGVWLFVAFTGAPESAVRAGIMISLFVIAERFSRQGEAWRVGLYALALMLVQNPRALFDLGFQLSFLATTGIIIAAGSAHQEDKDGFRALVRETLWAQAMVFPVIAYQFGTVSLLGVGANLVVLPLMPLAMGLSAVPAALGMVSLALGKLAALMAMPVLLGITKVIEWCAALPYASIPIARFGALILVGYYGMLVAIIALRRRTALVSHGE